MNTLIHADLFFFITSIVFVVVGIFATIALIYIILILRTAYKVTKTVKAESEEIIKDVKELRSSIKDEGLKMKTMTRFFGTILGRRKRKAE